MIDYKQSFFFRSPLIVKQTKNATGGGSAKKCSWNNCFIKFSPTIVDNSNEKLRPPLPPISMMGKWARFGFGPISLFVLSKIVG